MRKIRHLSLWLAPLLLGGCLAKEAQAPKLYELTYKPSAPQSSCASKKRLGIATPSALGKVDRVEIPYNEGSRVGYYVEHRWVDLPSSMLQRLLLDALSSSCFEPFLPPFSAVLPPLVLQSKILTLEVRLRPEGGAVAVAEVAFSLAGEKSHSWVIRHQEPLERIEASLAIEAMNRALNKVVQELDERLGAI